MIPPKEFFKKIKPFSFLTESELQELVSNLEVVAFEEEDTIIKKGDKIDYVYVVFSGLVGIYENGERVDTVTKGEIFGVFGERSKYVAKAEEDTICYLIKRELFEKLLNSNQRFSKFFKTFLERRFRAFSEITKETVFEDRIFLTKISSIITKKPVVCSPHTSIRDAAIKMELNRVGSIVVVVEGTRPVGILTDHDLRHFIIHGKNPEEKVSAYMSSPPICIDEDLPIFEAYLEILRKGINHLIVTKNGKVTGVITSKDLLAQFEPSTSLITLYRRIRKATSLMEIRSLFYDLKKSVVHLVLKGLHFYDLSRMITGVYDCTVQSVIELIEDEMKNSVGKLPPYLWIHMGSSARMEQVIATDQDNAIIHEGDDEKILLEFARRVNNALDAIGIPKCPGNYMASNPNWNMSLEEWIEKFEDWFLNLTPENVRYLSIFLDIRPIYGKSKFYEELLEGIYENVTMQSLRFLAHDSVAIEPPSGLFGLRKLEKVDLKLHGIYPIVNGVRVLALENKIINITNTRERIEKLYEIDVIQEDLRRDLIESYEFIQDLRLKYQSKSIIEGKNNGNVINLHELDRIDVFVLKECFKIISGFQKFLKGKYAIERGL